MNSSKNGPFDRIPPQNIEAEQSVLGAMMLGEPAAVDTAAELLHPSDFYREAHANIWLAMLALRGRGEPIDAITLKDELVRRNQYEAIGGAAYLMALMDVTFTTASLAHYARIVRGKSTLRRMIEAASQIIGTAYADPEDVPAALAEAERRIMGIEHERDAGEWVPLSESLAKSMEELDERFHSGGKIIGMPTGLIDLDLLLGGLRDSDLVILAARPGMGKTGMAATLAVHAALDHQKRVAFFSLEMSHVQIADRIVCAAADVDAFKHSNGRISAAEWDRVKDATQQLWDASLWTDPSSDLTVSEIRSRARRLQAKGGVDMVIVDYLQLLRGEGQGGPQYRVHEVTEMARGLKSLAKELDVPVVALAQLSRGVEQREDKRPLLSDLRDSGGIEEAADVVLFLYRAAYYARGENPPPADPAQPPPPEEAEVIVGKNRKGRTGSVKVGFEPAFVRFVNLPDEATNRR